MEPTTEQLTELISVWHRELGEQLTPEQAYAAYRDLVRLGLVVRLAQVEEHQQ